MYMMYMLSLLSVLIKTIIILFIHEITRKYIW